MRVQHAPPARGHNDPAVSPGCLQVRVQRVFGPVHRKQTIHQVPLDLRQAVLRSQQVLHVFLYAVSAEARAEQDGDQHGRRGEKHRVIGYKVAQFVE